MGLGNFSGSLINTVLCHSFTQLTIWVSNSLIISFSKGCGEFPHRMWKTVSANNIKIKIVSNSGLI